MIDETGTTPAAAETAGAAAGEPIVAFCQQCGRGLTASSQRRVGTGIYCEPCGTARSTQTAGWTSVNAGSAFPYAPNSPVPPTNAEPNPVLAGFLGLIPGVGAMFNGQYAKGVIHLVVFVVLVSLADNLNWVFWWFVWGWIFYQAFEAYHTALARRDGQPLPDPFGWNELGDRLGFARTWPQPNATTAPRPPVSAPAPPPVYPAPSSAIPEGFTPVSHVPDSAAASQNPFPSAPPPPPFSASPGAAPGSPYTQVPYQYTYAGSPIAGVPPAVLVGSRRFPVGAAWLIGLGVLFLLGNMMPTWHIEGRWLVPILLAAIALWTGASRVTTLRETIPATSSIALSNSLASVLVGPGILLTLAILLALHDASLIPLRHSWPALLIVWGALVFLQRAAAADPPVVPVAGAPVASPTPGPSSR